MNSKKLDQYYTKSSIASKCYQTTLDIINKNNISFDLWLEPSAGAGSFFNILPDNKIGVDLEPKVPGVLLHDFLTFDLAEDRYITIGNPPFGKNSSLAIKFFNKCAEKSELIAFIVPKTFKKNSTVQKLNNFFHLIHEEELPSFSFEFEGEDYDVPCVFQIWQKLPIERTDKFYPKTHNDFIFTTKDKADFAIQRVGVNAGTVKEDFKDCAIASHYFLKSSNTVKEIFSHLNWDTVKYNTAGNPSISKAELVYLYQLKKIE